MGYNTLSNNNNNINKSIVMRKIWEGEALLH